MRTRQAWIGLFVLLLSGLPANAGEREEAFWEAARQGDLATIERLHAAGVEIDARTKYRATALSFACDKGRAEVARWLLENGADIENEDTFYSFTPLRLALYRDHFEIVEILMANGAKGADQVLTTGARKNDVRLVKLALASPEIESDHVAQALAIANDAEDSEAIVELLQNAEVKQSEHVTIEVDPAILGAYVGRYRNAEADMAIDVSMKDGKLIGQATGQPPLNLRPVSDETFEVVEAPQIKLTFGGRGGLVERLVLEQGSRTTVFPRVDETAEAVPPEPETAAEPEPTVTPEAVATPAPIVVERQPARDWPGFRGPGASGNGDGQGAPADWDLESGKNIRWITEIPGLANSSPIIWGDRVFVTTAVSVTGNDSFRSGLYGDVESVDDDSEHQFKVYGLDKTTGKILWEKTTAQRVPGALRHMKATQANSTPVTDGKHVVALFGAIGVLACYGVDGEEHWKADVGVLDSGWFYDKSYQWGHASSPIIYKDLVIVQADIQEDSFVAAYRLSDGKQAWKTPREEIPTWGTPTIYHGEARDELITNGTTIRGYDPNSGKELWTLGPNSEVTVATPIVAHDLIYVTAGYAPVRPVYAIRPGGSGDLSLPDKTTSSDRIAWSLDRDGTYMPTPIAYGDRLYTCNNNGRMTSYDAKTGERVYRARVGGGGTFTASPVAADARLYFATEDGDIVVVRAGGDEYEELGKYPVGGICMATPAISDGLMVVRTLKQVIGIGEPPSEE